METKRTQSIILLLLFVTGKILAASMPQDYWWSDYPTVNPSRDFIPGTFQCVAVGPNGYVYMGTNNLSISVWAPSNGTIYVPFQQFGTFHNIRGLAVDSKTNVYVKDYDGQSPSIFVYGPTGNLLRSWGGIGTNTNQFGASFGASHTEIAIDASDRLIVVDSGSDRVVVYAPDGGLWSSWSAPGPKVVAVLPNGNILVRSASISQVFDLFGNLVLAGGLNGLDFAITPDGLIATQSTQDRLDEIDLCDPFQSDGSFLKISGVTNALARGGGLTMGLTFDRLGRMFYIPNPSGTSEPGLRIGWRHYSGDVPLQRRVLPQPRIVNSFQRTNTSLVDIDFIVSDADSPYVQVGVLAFANGGNDLNSIIPMRSFVEGSATNIGLNVKANETHRLSWDSTEAISNFADIQFEILAKDDRELMGFHFITLPEPVNGTNVSIATLPLMDPEMLNLWFWLITQRDPEITFTNGVVRGNSGLFVGQTLASGTSTTSAGRKFLFERLHVRAINDAERIKAQGGNYGFRPGYVDNNSVVRVP